MVSYVHFILFYFLCNLKDLHWDETSESPSFCSSCTWIERTIATKISGGMKLEIRRKFFRVVYKMEEKS